LLFATSLICADARAQVNNIQEFRHVGWTVTEAARAIATPAWFDASDTEARTWFGEDEDGAGIDAACGVRVETGTATFNVSNQPMTACDGIVTDPNACLDLFSFFRELAGSPGGLLIRANNGFDFGPMVGLFDPMTGSAIVDIDNPLFAEVNARSVLLNGIALKSVDPPGPLLGTHLDLPALSNVVTVEQCTTYRTQVPDAGTGLDLPCHLPTLTSDASLLPGIETTCTVEGNGETCQNGRCTGPPQPECFGQPDGTLCTEGPGQRCQDGQCTASTCFLQADGTSCGSQQVCDMGICVPNECEEQPNFSSCDLFSPLPGYCVSSACIPGTSICGASETPEGFICGVGQVCRAGTCQSEGCTDSDGDSICDMDDNCVSTPNTDQANGDADMLGDACDNCPNDPLNDVDLDGICAPADNCPLEANPLQVDSDSDGTGDACTPIHYAALGDSFASGEGNPSEHIGSGYIPPTASDGNGCHRSLNAYPMLINDPSTGLPLSQNFVPGGFVPQFFLFQDFLACSGATTKNVRSQSNGGMPRDHDGQTFAIPDDVPQLDRMRSLVGPAGDVVDEHTDLVTITIGGNEASFAKVLIHCAIKSDCQQDSFGFAGGMRLDQFLPQQINGPIRTNVMTLLSQIRADAPNASVIVVGYPRLFGGTECGDVRFPPFLPFWKLSETEQQFLIKQVDALNTMLGEVAAEVGVHFIPNFSDRFKGHEICDDPGPSWFNNLEIGFGDRQWRGSFHPNQRGQLEYANAVNEHIEGLRASGWPLLGTGLPKNPESSQTTSGAMAAAT